MGSGRRHRPGDSGAAAQLWRASTARRICPRRFWDSTSTRRTCNALARARRTAVPLSSATTATWAAWPKHSVCVERPCERDHARARLRPRVRLHRRAMVSRSMATRWLGMEGAHMPAPLQLLGMQAVSVRMRPDWGCVEVYTTISGLPHLLDETLPKYPNHELASSPLGRKERALALRGLAQKGDPLATRDLRLPGEDARAFTSPSLAMALDPAVRVIGGGLMDPEATTEAFRERYLRIGPRDRGIPYLWTAQKERLTIVPGGAGRSVAGDRRRARGAVSGALVIRGRAFRVGRRDLARLFSQRSRPTPKARPLTSSKSESSRRARRATPRSAAAPETAPAPWPDSGVRNTRR